MIGGSIFSPIDDGDYVNCDVDSDDKDVNDDDGDDDVVNDNLVMMIMIIT